MRANRMKQLWRENKPAFGVWADLGSPGAVEAMVQLPIDWILLDGEHGVSSYEDCFTLLQAMNGSNVTSIIRVPWYDRIAIKRSLDMGAEGVMVPYIKTAEDVAGVVRACRYPPVGDRGIGPYRASKYDTDFVDYVARANEEVIVCVQIENKEAYANIDAILGVPGLDSIFIGPSDLAASMGYFPNLGHPEVQKAVTDIFTKARKAGIPVGYYCNSGEESRARAEQGFQMISVGNDMVLLNQALQRNLDGARGKK